MAQVQFTRQFGVHSKLKQRIEIYNHVYLGDALMIAAFGIFVMEAKNFYCFQGDTSNWPYLLFVADMMVTCIYLLIHPRSNPGKANWELLLMTFIHTTRFFQSINAFQDYYRIHCPLLDNHMPYRLNHRLPVNIKYLYHSDDDDYKKNLK